MHGDDFLSKGPAESLMKMNLALEKNFQVKTEICGPDPGQQREARLRNRVIRWEDTGITWEPDPRHAEIMIEQMGPKGARSLKIPKVTEENKTDRELRADIGQIIDENKYPEENNIITHEGTRGGVDNCKQSTCCRHHAKSNSRNDLLKHINQEGHIAAKRRREQQHRAHQNSGKWQRPQEGQSQCPEVQPVIHPPEPEHRGGRQHR